MDKDDLRGTVEATILAACELDDPDPLIDNLFIAVQDYAARQSAKIHAQEARHWTAPERFLASTLASLAVVGMVTICAGWSVVANTNVPLGWSDGWLVIIAGGVVLVTCIVTFVTVLGDV